MAAALISEGAENQREQLDISLGVPTSLPGYELTNFVVGSAVDVWKEGGEAWNGDVLGEQVEVWNPIPDFGFGCELLKQ